MKIKGCGVVCEYNPFHNGHKYQIEKIKETLGLPVICAMSGNFVQRGEPACMNKQIRAESAVSNGASVVLEIPFPYSSMTAERFAMAGVEILDRCGMCSHIAFGSECGDIGILKEIAEALSEDHVKTRIRTRQKENPSLSYIRARQQVLCHLLGERLAAVSAGQNDILAIEYLKAINKLGSALVPVALKRSHERTDHIKETFASSSQIRDLLAENEREKAGEFVPDEAVLDGYSLNTGFYKALFVALMTKTPEDLKAVCELGGGVEHALCRAVGQTDSYRELFKALHFKTVTDAKLRRMLLFAGLDISSSLAFQSVPYTMVLAASKDDTAIALLRSCRKDKTMLVAQRVRELRKEEKAFELYQKNVYADRFLQVSRCLFENK